MTDDLLFQEFAGEVDPALDGSEGFPEHIGDLVVFVSVKVQQKRRFEDLGEIADGGVDLFKVDVVLGLIGNGGGTM